MQVVDAGNLVKKTNYNTKISETEKKITDGDHSNKYISTQGFNKLTAENFVARSKLANSTTKADIGNFVQKQILKKI